MSDTAQPSNASAQPASAPATSPNPPAAPQTAPTAESGFRQHLDQQRTIQQTKDAQKKLDMMIEQAVQKRLASLAPAQEPTGPPPTESRVEQLEQQLAEFRREKEQGRLNSMKDEDRKRVRAALAEAGDFPGILAAGDQAGDAVYQLMEQEYQQTGAWPSESEVASRVEEDLKALYQKLSEAFGGPQYQAPKPAEPPTLSTGQTGAVSGQRSAEPQISDVRQLSSPEYMASLWRQVRNRR